MFIIIGPEKVIVDAKGIDPVRLKLMKVVNSTQFESAISVAIVLNVLVMSLFYYDASDEYKVVLDYFNLSFSVLFLLECIFKLIVLRLKYFLSGWNCFDFLIVCASVVDFVFTYTSAQIGIDLTVFRVLRAARMLRLVNKAEGLKSLLNALKRALPAFLNVGTLLFLMTYIYAVAGQAIFKGIPRDHKAFLNDHANFDTFGASFLTLFRVLTGESYNGIMHDCMPFTPCDSQLYNCGSAAAVPYFLSFVVVGQFVMLALFVAAVMEELMSVIQINAVQGSRLKVTENDVQSYANIWRKLSPQQTQEEKKKMWWDFSLLEIIMGRSEIRDEVMPLLRFRTLVDTIEGRLKPSEEDKMRMKISTVNVSYKYEDLQAYSEVEAIELARRSAKLKASAKKKKKDLFSFDSTGQSLMDVVNTTKHVSKGHIVATSVHYIDGLLTLGKLAFKARLTEEGQPPEMKGISSDNIVVQKNLEDTMDRHFKKWKKLHMEAEVQSKHLNIAGKKIKSKKWGKLSKIVKQQGTKTITGKMNERKLTSPKVANKEDAYDIF